MKNLKKDEENIEELETVKKLYEKLLDYENYDSESTLNLINTTDCGFLMPSGRAAIHLAAIDGRKKELRFMLTRNPDLVSVKSSSGMTPLAYSLSSEAVFIEKNSKGPLSKILLSFGSPNPFYYAFCVCSSWEQYAALCEFIQKNLKSEISLKRCLKEDLWMMLKTQNENRSDKDSFEKAVISIASIFADQEILDTRGLLKDFLSFIFKNKKLYLSNEDFEKLMSLFPLLAGYDMEPQMLLAMKFLNRQLEYNLVNLDEIARKMKLMKTIENYEKMVKLGKTENLDLMEFKHAVLWLLNFAFHIIRDEESILPEELTDQFTTLSSCLLPPDFRKLVKNVFSIDIIASDEKLENVFKGTPNGEKIKALVLPLRKNFKDTFRLQRWPSVSDETKSGASSSTSLTSSFSLNENAHNDVSFDM